jgi:hypothetical protein
MVRNVRLSEMYRICDVADGRWDDRDLGSRVNAAGVYWLNTQLMATPLDLRNRRREAQASSRRGIRHAPVQHLNA